MLFGLSKGKQFILDSIDKQIEERNKMFKHANKGEQLVKNQPLYKLNPFYILPLKHWRFHNEAEIKWLIHFREMVESIENFKEQYNKILKKVMILSLE